MKNSKINPLIGDWVRLSWETREVLFAPIFLVADLAVHRSMHEFQSSRLSHQR
jgi:hypothetical protein